MAGGSEFPERATFQVSTGKPQRAISMDVFRVESEDGAWVLYKVHGYKPIMRAGEQAELIEHVQAMTSGKGAVIRFWSDTGVRELRVGAVDDGEITGL